MAQYLHVTPTQGEPRLFTSILCSLMLAALSFVLFNNMLQKSVSIGYPSRERIHLSLKIQDWRTVEVEALVRARLDLINPYIINNHDQIDL